MPGRDATHDTRAPTLPRYDDPYVLTYPTAILFLGSAALAFLTAGLVGWARWLVYGSDMFDLIVHVEELDQSMQFTGNVSAFALPFAIALLVTTVGHEFLHGLAFRDRGYDVEYGIIPTLGVVYTAAPEQFQPREDLFAVGLAPLALITVLALPLVFVPVPHVALTASLVLILNTAGSIGDLYMCWQLWRLPADTKLYDLDMRRTLVFEPR